MTFFNKFIFSSKTKKYISEMNHDLKYLRVCLFEREIRWMENFGEKIGRKTFLVYVWLGREEEK